MARTPWVVGFVLALLVLVGVSLTLWLQVLPPCECKLFGPPIEECFDSSSLPHPISQPLIDLVDQGGGIAKYALPTEVRVFAFGPYTYEDEVRAAHPAFDTCGLPYAVEAATSVTGRAVLVAVDLRSNAILGFDVLPFGIEPREATLGWGGNASVMVSTSHRENVLEFAPFTD
ncbi:MAG: hypothetical protein AAF297_10325 [Planctomycetota bacterium]